MRRSKKINIKMKKQSIKKKKRFLNFFIYLYEFLHEFFLIILIFEFFLLFLVFGDKIKKKIIINSSFESI